MFEVEGLVLGGIYTDNKYMFKTKSEAKEWIFKIIEEYSYSFNKIFPNEEKNTGYYNKDLTPSRTKLAKLIPIKRFRKLEMPSIRTIMMNPKASADNVRLIIFFLFSVITDLAY